MPAPMSAGAPAAVTTYRIIVHPANPTMSVDRRFVADAFLKKITAWDHGEVIRPADLAPDSPVRRRFSEEVLRRSVEAVKSYWQQLIFAGREVPPPELESDQAVIRFVLHSPGAIGYVSSTADIMGARMLSLTIR
jgi:ABC-type phosphate transport system substrate-binding protein